MGGILDIVTDGESGLVVPPGDPQALAQAILSLLQDNDYSLRMGQAGRKRIQEIANLQENVGRRLELYRHVMKNVYA